MKKCTDINSPYCPCLLADTNHCVFCSKLQGKSSCDCDWSGVCIMYEKYWQDKLSRKAREDLMSRITEETDTMTKIKVGERTYLFEFTASEELANNLMDLGAFVFLRRANDPIYAHFPVGIMKVNGDKITVAVEAIGAKSSRFILNDTEKIIVRGPYSNGVLGKPWIDNITDGKILLVAGGIGQAPALPILKKLAEHNQVHLILAPGKVGTLFIREEIENLNITVYEVKSLRKEGFMQLKELFREKFDLVASAGPDEQHAAIIRLMQSSGVNIPMAATNNATMCCGEGICGSCHKLDQDNKTMKLCKLQVDFQQIMQE